MSPIFDPRQLIIRNAAQQSASAGRLASTSLRQDGK
jgi:hypothetical protein